MARYPELGLLASHARHVLNMHIYPFIKFTRWLQYSQYLQCVSPLNMCFYDLSMLIHIGLLCLFQLRHSVLLYVYGISTKKCWRRSWRESGYLCDALHVDLQAGTKQLETPHLLPVLSLDFVLCPQFPQCEPSSRTGHSKRKVLLRSSDGILPGLR